MVSIPSFLKEEEAVPSARDELSYSVYDIILVDGDGASGT